MVTLLLTTKLHRPPLRRRLIFRPRLVERLNAGLHRKMTVVSAPAGFGKTTLLGEWAERCEPQRQVAWLSLDPGDNDPARFMAYLSAALQTDEHATPPSQAAPSPPSERALIAVINRISARDRSLVLCLDDYHLITAQAVHDILAFLLDHQPENMHIILVTRSDPPLPLARLRVRGQLTEIRQADLRFTSQEATTFLRDAAGLELALDDIAALESRTEGWIAGLQMAVLAMQGLSPSDLPSAPNALHSGEPRALAAFVQAFTGSHRFILDYLLEEVLDQQPAHIQEFLLRTSILERLTAPLCDALAPADQKRPSQQILEDLDRANLFIVPLDNERTWYRYHRLFADLLRSRLVQSSPDRITVLHARASLWHEEQGLIALAIDHALAAGDMQRAATLIETSVDAILMRSEIVTFLHWVEQLPVDLLRRRPTLCFYHAWVLLMSGRSLDAVERQLHDMNCDPDDDTLQGRLTALDAYLMVFRADMDRAAQLSRQALQQLPERDAFLRSVMAWIIGLDQLSHRDNRDPHEVLHEVVDMGREGENPLIAVAALCHQARLEIRRGQTHQARQTLEQALALATSRRGERLPVASEALIGLGVLWREWNDLDAAEAYLLQAIELSKQWSELAAFDAYIALVRVRQGQGNSEGARQALDAAQQLARDSKATMLDDLVADLQEARFHVTQGDLSPAMRWAEKRRPALPESGHEGADQDDGLGLINERLRKYEDMVLARLDLALERTASALKRLDALLAQARHLERTDLIIEAQILRALALQASGEDEQAIEALVEALSLAEPGGFVRIFVDEGQPMVPLLKQAAARHAPSAYVNKLLAALGSEVGSVHGTPLDRPQILVEPLTDRELDVLRLLAQGLSNPEIADRLYIAVSTVRSHCKSIYGKLDVHRRWDAVQRAQELGLI